MKDLLPWFRYKFGAPDKTVKNPGVNDFINMTPEEYLKNYALSTCLAQGYHSAEVKNDAAAAARGYLEFGDYSLAAHTAARSLAQTFLARQYDSMSGEPMIAAKCIDLYHSKELQQLVEKFKGKTDN